ncbi:hypothetical protein AAMO2058_000290000 [Amorphochlora amoebiformis]
MDAKENKAMVELKTKYYTASVNLKFINSDKNPLDKLSEKEADELREGCQGLIFVYDTQRKSSFASLKVWAEFFKPKELDLRLLISNTRSKSTKITSSLSDTKATDFALDYLMELINVSYNDTEKVCSDTREKLGCSRIMEAMCSTVWSHMDMAVRKDNKPNPNPIPLSQMDATRAIKTEKKEEKEEGGNVVIITGSTPEARAKIMEDLYRQSSPISVTSPTVTSSESLDITLKTKYYSAKVKISSYVMIGNVTHCDAFVGVLGETVISDEIEKWRKFLETYEPECRLVISNPKISPEMEEKPNPTLTLPLILTPTSDTKSSPSEEISEKKEMLSEKVGTARIFEALTCIPWKHMSLTSQKRNAPLKEKPWDSNESRDSFSTGDLVEIFGLKAKPHYNGRRGKIGGFLEKKGRFSVILEPAGADKKGGAKLNIKPKNLKKVVENVGSETSKPMAKPKSVDEKEKCSGARMDGSLIDRLDDDMEKMMSEIRMARDSANDLPDSERRRRAEETILKFVSMLEKEEKDIAEAGLTGGSANPSESEGTLEGAQGS